MITVIELLHNDIIKFNELNGLFGLYELNYLDLANATILLSLENVICTDKQTQVIWFFYQVKCLFTLHF